MYETIIVDVLFNYITPTDSMVLNLKTNNIIQGSNILKSLFDFSNLNEGNKLFCEENKKSW